MIYGKCITLSGIEVLVALEELDVTENFLLDHRVLQGLIALKRLQVVSFELLTQLYSQLAQ